MPFKLVGQAEVLRRLVDEKLSELVEGEDGEE